MEIPAFLHIYFWDVDPATLTLAHDGKYIIERILEWGDERAVAWLNEHFSEDERKAVVQGSRRLSSKSRNYWGLIYHLWSTNNPSAQKREGIWQR